IIYDIVDLVEGRCRLRQALIRDRFLPELYLLPAAQSRDKTALSPADMVRVCASLRGECDLVLIDSPAGIESGFRNAVAPADEFVLVTTPDAASLQDVDRVLGILESESRQVLGLIINRVHVRLVKRKAMPSADDILRTLSVRLIGLVLEDEEVLIANGRGVPVAHDPTCLSGKAFHDIARRMLGESVPFAPEFGHKSFWERLPFGLGRNR
ncbi:MAG: septum site-determining protein MinD, partial [Chloroflexota bacterium]